MLKLCRMPFHLQKQSFSQAVLQGNLQLIRLWCFKKYFKQHYLQWFSGQRKRELIPSITSSPLKADFQCESFSSDPSAFHCFFFIKGFLRTLRAMILSFRHSLLESLHVQGPHQRCQTSAFY